MKKIKIDLEYCYGIRSLKTEFDFTKKKLFVVYAPNGAMKSSLAKTFQDLSNDRQSTDRIFKNRKTKRLIKNESNSDIGKDQVFVIEPYNENYKSAKLSTLLVNKTLKEAYDLIYENIDEKKEILVKELKASSGLPKDSIEETLASDITHDPKEFFVSLSRVQKEVLEEKASQLAGIMYQIIFNDKVLVLLESAEFKQKLTAYMTIYDQLIGASTFFRKGIFNHNNAADIAKNLKDNGFFKANHSVYITVERVKKEIKTEAELENVIQQEKENILKNPELTKSFEEIDKKIVKNKELKDFREYIEKNKAILPELDNLPRFKQKLWVAYLINSIGAYKELMRVYEEGKQTINNIVKQAKEEKTKWGKVIDIFNERFSVPFKVSMGNQEDVILKSDAPSIKFEFKDTEGDADVEMVENDLWSVLSNGEKRALYILNIIFEVEAREEARQETLFVVDDIADSFDYKNKYAIIEYLNDISKKDYFHQIILTHNFDFFRTLSSRLNVPNENKLHTVKTKTSTRLVQEKYPRNPFATWKDNFANDEMLIASIPFVRNLAEYCGIKDSYNKLTSLLHLKADTDSISVGDLEVVFKDVLKGDGNLVLQNHDRTIKKMIYDVSDKIFSEQEEVIELEKKIVLSIAIRLKTEEFLIRQINDDAFVKTIARNQTITLIEKYKEKFPCELGNIRLAEQVNLMTPENIHINSFMYEPILDMSNDHLKQLYRKVCDIFVDRVLVSDSTGS